MSYVLGDPFWEELEYERGLGRADRKRETDLARIKRHRAEKIAYMKVGRPNWIGAPIDNRRLGLG